jgi:hypothetical protein
MSVPLKPPPPNCTDDPFHCVGRLTSKRIGGAFGSTGAMVPSTLQYSGAAGTTARKEGSGLNGSSANASGVGCLSSADSIVAPPFGRPISAAGIDSFSRAHASSGVQQRTTAGIKQPVCPPAPLGGAATWHPPWSNSRAFSYAASRREAIGRSRFQQTGKREAENRKSESEPEMLRLLIPTSTSVFSRLSLAVKSQWCQNIASRMIIGSGIPRSQSSIPRPSPMADLQFVCRPNNVDSPQEFQTEASRFARGHANGPDGKRRRQGRGLCF